MTTHLHAPTPIRARARVDLHLPTLSHQKVFHGIKGGKVSPGPAVYRGMARKFLVTHADRIKRLTVLVSVQPTPRHKRPKHLATS